VSEPVQLQFCSTLIVHPWGKSKEEMAEILESSWATVVTPALARKGKKWSRDWVLSGWTCAAVAEGIWEVVSNEGQLALEARRVEFRPRKQCSKPDQEPT
jgi:hypothetical protein